MVFEPHHEHQGVGSYSSSHCAEQKSRDESINLSHVGQVTSSVLTIDLRSRRRACRKTFEFVGQLDFCILDGRIFQDFSFGASFLVISTPKN